MILHHIIKFLKHSGLAHSLCILHPRNHSGIFQYLIEAIEIPIRTFGKHYLFDPFDLYLIIIFFYLGLDMPEELIVQKARTCNNQTLYPCKIQRGNSVIAFLEKFQ